MSGFDRGWADGQLTDKNRLPNVASTAHPSVQVAGVTVMQSDGPRALRDSRAALDAISHSLTDLTAFWERETQYLSANLSNPQDKLPKQRELGELTRRWERYREVIQAGISSISVSLGAAKEPISMSLDVAKEPTILDKFDYSRKKCVIVGDRTFDRCLVLDCATHVSWVRRVIGINFTLMCRCLWYNVTAMDIQARKVP